MRFFKKCSKKRSSLQCDGVQTTSVTNLISFQWSGGQLREVRYISTWFYLDIVGRVVPYYIKTFRIRIRNPNPDPEHCSFRYGTYRTVPISCIATGTLPPPTRHKRIFFTTTFRSICCSVPDPPDRRGFWPPGSGSFYHAKIIRKTLNPTILWFFLTFYL